MTYAEPTLFYDGSDVGILHELGAFARSALGIQSGALGQVSWLWSPYIQALYEMDISDQPVTTYRHLAPRVYTRP